MLYSLGPAVAGFAAAQILLAPARGLAKSKGPQVRGFILTLSALPTTAVIFAFVCAFLASQSTTTTPLAMPLVVVGAAGAVCCVLQGLIVRQGFEKVAKDPAQFGKLLVRSVMPETIVLLAFVWFFLQLGLQHS